MFGFYFGNFNKECDKIIERSMEMEKYYMEKFMEYVKYMNEHNQKLNKKEDEV